MLGWSELNQDESSRSGSVIEAAIRNVELVGLRWARNRWELGKRTVRRREMDGDLVRNEEKVEGKEEEEHIGKKIRVLIEECRTPVAERAHSVDTKMRPTQQWNWMLSQGS